MGSLSEQRELRAALFFPGACCEVCGEADPLVLNPDVRLVLCADCAAVRRGHRPIEEHHIAGRRRGPWTILVRCNEHRRLGVRAQVWLERLQWLAPQDATQVALLRGLGDLLFEIDTRLEVGRPYERDLRGLGDLLHERADALEEQL